MSDLPEEIQVWRSYEKLDHIGTWSTERYPEEAVTYVPKASILALEREKDDANTFLDNAIASSPQPLQDLGSWLADMLDEDHWPTAERLLNAALKSCNEQAERGARICEALHRKGVSPEKWPDYFRVRAVGDALLAKEKQP